MHKKRLLFFCCLALLVGTAQSVRGVSLAEYDRRDDGTKSSYVTGVLDGWDYLLFLSASKASASATEGQPTVESVREIIQCIYVSKKVPPPQVQSIVQRGVDQIPFARDPAAPSPLSKEMPNVIHWALHKACKKAM